MAVVSGNVCSGVALPGRPGRVTLRSAGRLEHHKLIVAFFNGRLTLGREQYPAHLIHLPLDSAWNRIIRLPEVLYPNRVCPTGINAMQLVGGCRSSNRQASHGTSSFSSKRNAARRALGRIDTDVESARFSSDHLWVHASIAMHSVLEVQINGWIYARWTVRHRSRSSWVISSQFDQVGVVGGRGFQTLGGGADARQILFQRR